MALLAIQERGVTSLNVKGGSFVVARYGKEIMRRPVHEIDHVELYGKVDLQAAALEVLMKEGINTVFLTKWGGYRGQLVSEKSPYAERRRAQYQALADPAQTLTLARAVVVAKLENQRLVLRGLRRDRVGARISAAKVALRALKRRATEAPSLDALRGFEGHGAHMYFKALSEAFTNPAFTFSGRNRRPPRDPINACLSFGYTLLLNRVVAAVQRAGLDPYLGALHDPGRGKPALALDLMEPYRPLLVDRAVLVLINRRQLTPDDFAQPDVYAEMSDACAEPTDADGRRSPAVYLSELGRPILIRELSARWKVRVKREGAEESLTIADQLLRDAYRLRHFFDGTQESPTFLLG